MASSPSSYSKVLSSTSISHSTNSKGKAKQSLLGKSNPISNENATNEEIESDEDEDLTFQDAPEVNHDSEDLLIGQSIQNQNQASSSTSNQMELDSSPSFAAIPSASHAVTPSNKVVKGQVRKVPIPPHRMTPLKNEWPKIYTPLVEMAKLQVRMNVQKKAVEIRVSEYGCCEERTEVKVGFCGKIEKTVYVWR